jgi:hypothetical protein
MSNYFKEAATVTQKLYGEYCNVVRAEGLEPVPYHSYGTLYNPSSPLPRNANWILHTRRINNGKSK